MKFRFILIFAFVLTTMHAVDDVRVIVSDWVQSNRKSANDELAIESLLSTLARVVPDPAHRLEAFYTLAMTESDPQQQQEYRMLLRGMWRDLAPAAVRASFITERVPSADATNIKSLFAYLEVDLLRSVALEAVESGKVQEPTGSMREQYYSVSEYQPRDGLLNARIAGMLFEIAPASAVLELSAAGKYPQVRAWIEAVEDLRGQLETAQSRDAASLAWDGAQAILQQMVNMDDPALDAYVARVLAWRSIVAPALNNAASIVDPLVARKNEVTLYLLSAHGVQELLVVPPNATADFKGAKGNIAHGSPVSNKIATVLADKTSVSTPDMSAVKLAESYEEPRFFVLSFLAAGIVAWATGLWWLVFRRRK